MVRPLVLWEVWMEFSQEHMPDADSHHYWSWGFANTGDPCVYYKDNRFRYADDYEAFKAAVEAGDAKALEILPKFVAFRLERGG